MRIERLRNASRNMLFGVLLRMYNIIVPFAMRTIMIYFMGVQYLGISSLFSSILQVLNLAELGVASAMVYSMYKPIAEDDNATICALLRMYRTYYRIIGLVIAVIGLMLTPFIPRLIKSDFPSELNVYILYLLNLLAVVLSYWFFAYKNSVFQAHQRLDIVSKITLISNTIQYVVQIFVMVVLKNYYIFLIVSLIMQVNVNILTALAATKMFPQYKPEGKLPDSTIRGINSRIGDLFTAKLGAVVVNSVDAIVISAFLGLRILAIYQNYFFILTSISGFVTEIFNACTAGIGNSLIVESKQKNLSDIKKFTFIISWISGFCVCCFLNLYQPFMELWVGKELMLDFGAVICFCVYFFVIEINGLLNLYKDAGGIWYKDRFRPLVTAFANLAMNLIMVQFWGIYGVLLSTVLSMLLVGMPWLFRNLFTTLFDPEYAIVYLKSLLRYVFVVVLSCIISYGICNMIQVAPLTTMVLRMGICIIIPNAVYYIAYGKYPEFLQALQLADKLTKSKFNLYRLARNK